MDRGLAVVLTACAGGLVALQAPINAGLGKATGSLPAALVSFAVGSLCLAGVVVLSGKAAGLGSTYVTTALLVVPAIGAGGVAAATVTGQLTAAVVVDRLGLFGLDQVPLNFARLAGVALLLAGTYLVLR